MNPFRDPDRHGFQRLRVSTDPVTLREESTLPQFIATPHSSLSSRSPSTTSRSTSSGSLHPNDAIDDYNQGGSPSTPRRPELKKRSSFLRAYLSLTRPEKLKKEKETEKQQHKEEVFDFLANRALRGPPEQYRVQASPPFPNGLQDSGVKGCR
jgi:hypothetical protein